MLHGVSVPVWINSDEIFPEQFSTSLRFALFFSHRRLHFLPNQSAMIPYILNHREDVILVEVLECNVSVFLADGAHKSVAFGIGGDIDHWSAARGTENQRMGPQSDV